MGEYHITGGRDLSGQIQISGAKNAALPILAASLLTKGAIIHRIPDLSDTRVCADILKNLGCYVSFKNNVIIVEPSLFDKCELSPELCGKMRSSVTFLGALLGTAGEAVIYTPGGCTLGERPIDIHLDALKKMGVNVVSEGNKITCCGKPKGCNITLRYPSVGATENIMLAAVLANGITTVEGCAAEPEIADLAQFLNAAGAKIKGAGTRKITIEGVKSLCRCEYTIMSDRIEAGTYMCAAAITGGELFIKGADPRSLRAVTEAVRQTGCVIKESRDIIYIDAPKCLSPIKHIAAAPYPLFPTDMQPQLTSVLSVARGKSRIEETVFEARYKHISELNKMGADIVCEDNKSFTVNGVKKLKGCEVTAHDLRGGAALVIAALNADGKSRVTGAEYIKRGYERLEDKLTDVGANIFYKS